MRVWFVSMCPMWAHRPCTLEQLWLVWPPTSEYFTLGLNPRAPPFASIDWCFLDCIAEEIQIHHVSPGQPGLRHWRAITFWNGLRKAFLYVIIMKTTFFGRWKMHFYPLCTFPFSSLSPTRGSNETLEQWSSPLTGEDGPFTMAHAQSPELSLFSTYQSCVPKLAQIIIWHSWILLTWD